MRLNRRSFMKLIPAVAVVVAGGGAWWFLAQTAREPMITSQVASTTTAVSQATPTTATTAAGFEFPITWNGDHPSTINSNAYRLKIDGDVSNPLELKLEELYAMNAVQKTLKIRCVDGWVAEVPWEGIPLSYLLKQAGSSPKSGAHVTISAITGYSTTLSSDEAANLDNMIALKVGGAPLTVDHGYPARLVAPSRKGAEWVKYVSGLTYESN
jgi:DMSO/TMAO reductase YedYZ molybdopterin-dependent catalytic subunit